MSGLLQWRDSNSTTTASLLAYGTREKEGGRRTRAPPPNFPPLVGRTGRYVKICKTHHSILLSPSLQKQHRQEKQDTTFGSVESHSPSFCRFSFFFEVDEFFFFFFF